MNKVLASSIRSTWRVVSVGCSTCNYSLREAKAGWLASWLQDAEAEQHMAVCEGRAEGFLHPTVSLRLSIAPTIPSASPHNAQGWRERKRGWGGSQCKTQGVGGGVPMQDTVRSLDDDGGGQLRH